MLFDIVKKGFAHLPVGEKSDELFHDTTSDIPPDVMGESGN